MTRLENMYSPELIREVGLVVMQAAWVEDVAGELIHLKTILEGGDESVQTKGWADSGEQLAVALEKVVGKALA